MKNFLLYLWQLPQNIIGLFVILFSKAKKDGDVYKTDYYFGVSLGKYIIVNKNYGERIINHEKGHQIQSKYLGILYLLIVGLPSASRNIVDRYFHKKWTIEKRLKWYYGGFPENWADKLGGVERW